MVFTDRITWDPRVVHDSSLPKLFARIRRTSSKDEDGKVKVLEETVLFKTNATTGETTPVATQRGWTITHVPESPHIFYSGGDYDFRIRRIPESQRQEFTPPPPRPSRMRQERN
ncbi:MAG TPA: hypothetical protein VEW42_05070 [Candidatus Eisenbacteria bacterium]|nr:hypothetical protein [Candidatus Eisenbacteria bacterium]